ncbi:hypothetical protein L484_020239 [Morus notabilis]|uniref:Uncharacterized protein n=1 Tax=Morus notabilis TaxID=981085 RepID=W9RM76_9ROSA|nr:hypothetical protein L484_020239 [Morus notabilis]
MTDYRYRLIFIHHCHLRFLLIMSLDEILNFISFASSTSNMGIWQMLEGGRAVPSLAFTLLDIALKD